MDIVFFCSVVFQYLLFAVSAKGQHYLRQSKAVFLSAPSLFSVNGNKGSFIQSMSSHRLGSSGTCIETSMKINFATLVDLLSQLSF